jgi:hypothetical protein
MAGSPPSRLPLIRFVTNRRMQAQQASSTRQCEIQRYCACVLIIITMFMLNVEYKKIVNVFLSSDNTVPYIVLAVMCIYVIYKCLS